MNPGDKTISFDGFPQFFFKGSNGKDLKMDNLWITQVSYSMNDDSKTIKIKCTDGARKEAMTEEFK